MQPHGAEKANLCLKGD